MEDNEVVHPKEIIATEATSVEEGPSKPTIRMSYEEDAVLQKIREEAEDFFSMGDEDESKAISDSAPGRELLNLPEYQLKAFGLRSVEIPAASELNTAFLELMEDIKVHLQDTSHIGMIGVEERRLYMLANPVSAFESSRIFQKLSAFHLRWFELSEQHPEYPGIPGFIPGKTVEVSPYNGGLEFVLYAAQRRLIFQDHLVGIPDFSAEKVVLLESGFNMSSMYLFVYNAARSRGIALPDEPTRHLSYEQAQQMVLSGGADFLSLLGLSPQDYLVRLVPYEVALRKDVDFEGGGEKQRILYDISAFRHNGTIQAVFGGPVAGRYSEFKFIERDKYHKSVHALLAVVPRDPSVHQLEEL